MNAFEIPILQLAESPGFSEIQAEFQLVVLFPRCETPIINGWLLTSQQLVRLLFWSWQPGMANHSQGYVPTAALGGFGHCPAHCLQPGAALLWLHRAPGAAALLPDAAGGSGAEVHAAEPQGEVVNPVVTMVVNPVISREAPNHKEWSCPGKTPESNQFGGVPGCTSMS